MDQQNEGDKDRLDVRLCGLLWVITFVALLIFRWMYEDGGKHHHHTLEFIACVALFLLCVILFFFICHKLITVDNNNQRVAPLPNSFIEP